MPVPSGYRIPTDTLAVAQIGTDEDGQPEQQVSIALTEEGFSPAVVVVQAGTPVLWGIDNGLEDAASGTLILVPAYAARLELGPGENSIYLYPDQSFEISTGDHRFYAYVKVVEDVARLDEEAIREEAGSFETLIYPDAVFVSAGASCCG